MLRPAATITRRVVWLSGAGALLAACSDRPTPPASATPPAAPPPHPPDPALRTASDGRPMIAFAGLRYSVRPPLGWRLRPLAPRGNENAADDVVIVAAPGANTDPAAADTQISLEAFRKSDRAPSFEAKIENIASDRRRQRSDFTVEAELPMALPAAGRSRAFIYRMRNIPSGDFEALAFVDEGTVVAEMLLVTRTKAAFDATLPLFREMVRTYRRLD